jgi:hypothetical protein
MSNLGKLLVIFGAALGLILPTFTSMVYALDVPSTVEIEALTCGLEFEASSAAALDYGLLTPNEISADTTPIAVKNTGNTEGEVFIAGTDWKDASLVTQMLVGVTHYQVTNTVSYDAANVLSSTPFSMALLSPGTFFNLVFHVKAVLQNPGFSGPLTQVITYSAEC